MLVSSYLWHKPKSKFLILHRTSLCKRDAHNNRAIQSAYGKYHKIKRQEPITDPFITNIEKELIRNYNQPQLKGFETLWTNEHNA
jgi:hypothetical protein